MKKVATIQDIKNHPSVEKFIYEYDGKKKHSVILKSGFRFSNTECGQDIGTVKELCDSVNNYIEEKRSFVG